LIIIDTVIAAFLLAFAIIESVLLKIVRVFQPIFGVKTFYLIL
jgi:hypothetical protein